MHSKRIVTPGNWSLTDHIEHVQRADAYAVECLSDRSLQALPPVPEPELASRRIEQRRACQAILRGLTPAQRTRIYQHGAAEWTAAKTLRRMSGRVREHYLWMQEIARRLPS